MMKLAFDFVKGNIINAEVGSAHIGGLVMPENICSCLCCCIDTGGR
jgi:hypothetical protein